MPRQGENIRKRKDGRWEARYTKEGGNASGKYGSVYGKTYLEAKRKREQLLRQSIPQPQPDAIVFKDVLAAWQGANRVRLKEASVARYQNLMDMHILPALGNKRMDQLNTAVINQFLAAKLASGRLDGTGGLSASYVRSIAFVISSAIRYGSEEKLCAPLRTHIKKPSLPKKEVSVLDPEDQKRLEKYLMCDMNEEKLLIYLTLYTGLRIGEVCALCWEDINFQEGLLYVRRTVSRVWYIEDGRRRSKLVLGTPKTDASLRCIPLCSKLISVLQAFSLRKVQGPIIASKSGDRFISPRTFEYRYKKFLESICLCPVNYHVFRHTFATRCIECGVDIKSLSEILGHANVAITLNTYVHSSMELKRSQLEKLAS